MYRLVDVWIDEYKGLMDVWIGGCMDWWMYGLVNLWIGGCMD